MFIDSIAFCEGGSWPNDSAGCQAKTQKMMSSSRCQVEEVPLHVITRIVLLVTKNPKVRCTFGIAIPHPKQMWIEKRSGDAVAEARESIPRRLMAIGDRPVMCSARGSRLSTQTALRTHMARLKGPARAFLEDGYPFRFEIRGEVAGENGFGLPNESAGPEITS